MVRKAVCGWIVLLAAVHLAKASPEGANQPVLVERVSGLLIVSCLGREPGANASHTYVITHGFGGIGERFYVLAAGLAAHDPKANILVVDWSPGAVAPHPWAAAKHIDPTGDALGKVLVELCKRQRFDPARATFIGESFGNYVNNIAAQAIGKAGIGKVGGAVLLNPASGLGGYKPPVVKANYRRSVAFVTHSLYDARDKIADEQVDLPAPGKDDHSQHIYGVQWLRERIVAKDMSWLPLAARQSEALPGVEGVVKIR